MADDPRLPKPQRAPQAPPVKQTVPLTGGAYSARSVIANAQRCVNLFPETNPPVESPPVQVTHYLTPGLVTLLQPAAATVRAVYRASNGALYVVVGTNVYFIDTSFNATLQGTIAAGTTPVSLADNGSIVVLVDNTTAGYWISLAAPGLNTIVDPAFYGARRVCYLDGFFVFNRPNTNQFYLSPPFWNGVDPFDATYIASKTGGPDQIISIAVVNGNLWLVGQITSEVWYNVGAADFPFARQPGVFVEHGMLRGWTIWEADVEVFWLGRDKQGIAVVFMGKDYQAIRVSNYALEDILQGYGQDNLNDASGFTYQQGGHTFYVLVLPNANATWVYDISTGLWHERTWTNPGTGQEQRSRVNCGAFAYGYMIVGDHSNGKIYKWDLDAYNDDGDPIVRRRGFPHLVAGGDRISYASFQIDMAVGTPSGGPSTENVYVRWSDTRGETWGVPVALPLGFGTTNQFYQSPKIWRLGMARDRVFEVYWSFNYQTALQGAWITLEKAET